MEISVPNPLLYGGSESLTHLNQTRQLAHPPADAKESTAFKPNVATTTVTLSPEADALAKAEDANLEGAKEVANVKRSTVATETGDASTLAENVLDLEPSQGAEAPAMSASGERAEQTGSKMNGEERGVDVPLHDAKVFAYGALGIEHPDDRSHPKDTFYTAGKWVSAAVTLGTIVSLLV